MIGGVDSELTEELPQPDSRRSGLRRLRTDIAVGVLVLGCALVAARALSSKGSSGAASSPSPTPSVAAPVVPAAPNFPAATPFVTLQMTDGAWIPRPPLPPRTSADPRACPPGHACATTHAVPRALRLAVRHVFPRARVATVESIVLGPSPADRMWFRRITADLGDTRLVVLIEAPARSRAAQRIGPTTGTVVYTAFEPYAVILRVEPQTEGMLFRLLRLARDVRLLAPP